MGFQDAIALARVLECLDDTHPKEYPFEHPKHKGPEPGSKDSAVMPGASVTVEQQPWTLEEARRFCEEMEPVVDRLGFLLSIYGSTARRGRGRDLDVILCQKRVGASPEYALEEMQRHLKAVRIGKTESGLFAQLCSLLLMPDGHLLDVQIRMSSIRDAYDLYMSGKTNLLEEEG